MRAQSLKIHQARTRCLLYLLFAECLVNQWTLLVDFAVHYILTVIRQTRYHRTFVRDLRHIIGVRHKLAGNGSSVIIEHFAVHIAIFLDEFAVLDHVTWVL